MRPQQPETAAINIGWLDYVEYSVAECGHLVFRRRSVTVGPQVLIDDVSSSSRHHAILHTVGSIFCMGHARPVVRPACSNLCQNVTWRRTASDRGDPRCTEPLSRSPHVL